MSALDKIITILKELKHSFPSYTLGRHVSTALSDYKEIWHLTDGEFHNALNKYKRNLQQDTPHTDGSELDKIIKDGLNLNTILQEDEEDED